MRKVKGRKLSENDRNQIARFTEYLQDKQDMHPVELTAKHRDYLRVGDDFIKAIWRKNHIKRTQPA